MSSKSIQVDIISFLLPINFPQGHDQPLHGAPEMYRRMSQRSHSSGHID